MINKLDRERSSFERALESVQTFFGRTAIPIHLPIGCERDFKGVVDLVRMKAYTYTSDGDGKGKESDIPADLAEAAKAAHEALIEMVAEGNDALLEEFFDTGHAAGRTHPRRIARSRPQHAHVPGAVRAPAAQHRQRL